MERKEKVIGQKCSSIRKNYLLKKVPEKRKFKESKKEKAQMSLLCI